MHAFDGQTDGQTDRQTEFSSLDRVCIPRSAVKTKQSTSKMFIPCERSICLVFWQEEWLVGATSCTWNFGHWPRWFENGVFQSILHLLYDYKNFVGILFRFVTMHAFDRRTDGQTERPCVCIRSHEIKMKVVCLVRIGLNTALR